MNYRHARLTRQPARDVLKHWVRDPGAGASPERKATPFRAIDTHAGLGFYDLAADEAGRTGEWHDGIGRLDAPFPDRSRRCSPPKGGGVAAVRARHGDTIYPGSPAIIREFLRPGDQGCSSSCTRPTARGAARALQPGPAHQGAGPRRLDRAPRPDPPEGARGLVLIDPPYEVPGEIERLGRDLLKAGGNGRPAPTSPGTRSRTPRRSTGWPPPSMPPCPGPPCASTC